MGGVGRPTDRRRRERALGAIAGATSSLRPDDFEHDALAELPGVGIAEDEIRLRSAVTGAAVGEVAIRSARLGDDSAADPLLWGEIVVEGEDVLFGVYRVPQDGGR